MSAKSRNKGARVERRIVKDHAALDIRAEKISRTGYDGYDIDVYPYGRAAPLVCEAKARASAKGNWHKVKEWLGENDALFLVEDREPTIVAVPWRIWKELIGGSDA